MGGRTGETAELKSFDEIYEEIAVNCFRYLGFTSFSEVDRLTLREYRIMMKAAQLRQLDEQQKIHLVAWLSFAAQAKRKNGKPVYSKFERFFNFKKELAKIETKNTEKSRFSGIGKLLKKGE